MGLPARWALEKGPVSGPGAPDSAAAAAATASAHSDAEATVEPVAPVIEEGSKGEGDGQWGHLLLQHRTHTPVTVHQACGEGNADEVMEPGSEKGSAEVRWSFLPTTDHPSEHCLSHPHL